MTNFKKGDNGKPRFGLIPPNAELEVAAVLTHGGDKYGDDNWKQCDNWQRYADALGRHWNAYRRGERNDPETGRHHLAHLICCALFQLEHELESYDEVILPTDPVELKKLMDDFTGIPPAMLGTPQRGTETATQDSMREFRSHPHCRECD